MAVSAVHTLVGLTCFATPLAGIAVRGVVNVIADDMQAATAVWFMLFGGMLFIAGLALDLLEQADDPPALRPIGLALLALCGAGIALMPASGFWLALPPALVMVWQRPSAGLAG